LLGGDVRPVDDAAAAGSPAQRRLRGGQARVRRAEHVLAHAVPHARGRRRRRRRRRWLLLLLKLLLLLLKLKLLLKLLPLHLYLHLLLHLCRDGRLARAGEAH
jgi:hypothetical protein